MSFFSASWAAPPKPVEGLTCNTLFSAANPASFNGLSVGRPTQQADEGAWASGTVCGPCGSTEMG